MKHKILLVVGDADLSNKLAGLCMSAEISDIDEVGSCAAALERIEENQYDLVVCDDCLADGKTDAVICKIRVSNPNCPILAFSNDEATRSCMWERGCTSVVTPTGVEAALVKMLPCLS